MTDFLIACALLATALYVMHAVRIIMRDRKERDAFRLKNRKRVCLLIDGENLPSWTYSQIADLASQSGRVMIARVYADWGIASNSTWRGLLKKNGIEPVSVIPNVTGKNAVDITLALDAVELLKDDVADIFIIGSSDSDFVALYRRIMRHGKSVIVTGMAHAPEAVRNNCHDFVELINPNEDPVEQTASDAQVLEPMDPGRALMFAYETCRHDDGGWAFVSAIGNKLAERGQLKDILEEHHSLSAFVRTTEKWDIETHDKRMRIRPRQDAA